MNYAIEYDQIYFPGIILSMLALTIPSFWVGLKPNPRYVHNPCIEKQKEKKKLGAKMCSVVDLGLFRRRACMCPNGWMFGCQLLFSSLVHLPCCFICSFECCLEKPRPPLACCTSGFLPPCVGSSCHSCFESQVVYIPLLVSDLHAEQFPNQEVDAMLSSYCGLWIAL